MNKAIKMFDIGVTAKKKNSWEQSLLDLKRRLNAKTFNQSHRRAAQNIARIGL